MNVLVHKQTGTKLKANGDPCPAEHSWPTLGNLPIWNKTDKSSNIGEKPDNSDKPGTRVK